MRHGGLSDFYKDRRMASHFPDDHGPSVPSPALSMFLQDVAGRFLLRRRYGGDERGITIDLRGAEEDRQSVLRLLGSVSGRDYHDSFDAVTGLMEDAVRRLAVSGRALYEVCESSDGSGILLNGFPSKNVFRLFGWYIQIIPTRHLDLWGRRISVVRSCNVWDISMPRVLGGRLGHRRLLRNLRKFSRIGPRFLREEDEFIGFPPNYDVKKYARSVDIVVARSARRWGWMGRDYSFENNTEYYLYHKIITFRWAIELLRQFLLEEVNALISRLGIDVNVEMNGAILPDMILEVRRQMSQGEVSFGKAYKLTTYSV